MHENEKNPQQELPEEQPEMLPEELESFDLDEIMREFAAPEQMDDATLQIPQDALAQAQSLLQTTAEPDAPTLVIPQDALSREEQLLQAVTEPDTAFSQEEPEDLLISFMPQKYNTKVMNAVRITDETIRVDMPARQEKNDELGDTIRLENVEELAEKARQAQQAAEESPEEKKAEEPFSESWQPEYDQPMGEYEPPQPIIFHPRSRLRELKRKLVAGPEHRYYELNEIGFGKLQVAIFLSFLVVVLSAGATALYALGMVSAARMKLMVFCQFFAMLLSALLGCYQMLDGLADLFKGRFTLNTMLTITFAVCCADGVLCLQEQRVPCCAAFSLQVTMSLWSAYHRRNTEMGMMDTMRKAVQLDGIKAVPEYYDGCTGLLRAEGQVEDFMDNYNKPSRPEKVFSWYALAATLVSIGSGVAGWLLQDSLSFGLQVTAVSLLAAVPVTSFITLTRPLAVLERRLHKLGAVLCGWQGVVGLSRRAVFSINHEDLFPVGSCKLNGVKFYGSRDPDQVVAYCTALVNADGGGLVPLFDHLLTNRNGRHYDVENFRGYKGGIGGEVCGEPVLLGSLNCLKELGVEIPEGTSVSQAVYAAIDGEFCGVFAINYAKIRSSAVGLRTLCSYRGLRPILTSGDFVLTEEFVRSRFGVSTRRICFPQRELREELSQIQPKAEDPALAIVTGKGLAPFAFAITGARSLRTASWIGVAIHLLGGILGLAMMAVLAVLGAQDLLTPQNVLLYELIWMIPGILITEWTRSV